MGNYRFTSTAENNLAGPNFICADHCLCFISESFLLKNLQLVETMFKIYVKEGPGFNFFQSRNCKPGSPVCVLYTTKDFCLPLKKENSLFIIPLSREIVIFFTLALSYTE